MTASVDRAVVDTRSAGQRDGRTMGFIHYAAMAAHRAQDPAVMCDILGCPDTLRWWHIGEFDFAAAHFDSTVYAGLITGPDPEGALVLDGDDPPLLPALHQLHDR